MSPSPLVDIGWHTFILYTREYAEFCSRVAGRMIHHAPTDAGRETGDPAMVRRRTLAALTATGYPVDMALWRAAGGDCDSSGEGSGCSQCHAGCTDSP